MVTPSTPLSPFETRQLERLLRQDCSLAECHGVLAAVVIAPSLVPPSVWYPELVGAAPVFADAEQAQYGMQLMMRLYNGIGEAFRNEDFTPYGYPDNDAIRGFCKGFLRGSKLDQRWWGDREGTFYLMPMAVLAGEFDLTGEHASDGGVIDDPTRHVEKYREILPEMIASVYDHFTSKRARGTVKAPLSAPEPAPSQDLAELAHKAARKPGPNEPCHCDSGKKFKKCCGRIGGAHAP